MNSKFVEKDISEIVSKVATKAKAFHTDDTTGHDWWHVYRVWNLAKNIAQREGANLLVVELAALLHDMDDHKIAGADSDNLSNAKQTLRNVDASPELESKVIEVIKQVSFKGAGVDTTPTSLEACVVQDADRLDALGAIGIARAFAYGGSKNRELYNPEEQSNLHGSFHEYKNSKGSTLNHFYEKLLLLKDRMNTNTAKEIAEDRHEYMVDFVDRFLNEFNV
ncbi:MAG: HD domain-containing protein [Tenuifilaceae bacterium]|jgi:uncharacterized protein|nr:HD domain-containing protein [Tenuifilaceae bacterium]